MVKELQPPRRGRHLRRGVLPETARCDARAAMGRGTTEARTAMGQHAIDARTAMYPIPTVKN